MHRDPALARPAQAATPRNRDAERSERGLRCIQFGLPYSPNLGDGIISECLTHAVGTVAAGAHVRTLDLSARRDFGAQVVRNRRQALKLLSHLPQPVRHALVTRKLGTILDRAAPHWRAALAEADLVLIGGGQLFSDADLNFPIKIARAARLCQAAGVPVCIYAAGAARNWSAQGRRLFAEVLDTNLVTVGLRDADSCAAWTEQMDARGPEPVLMRDPGVLAQACYGPVAADDRVGICVSDPQILRYHGEGADASAGFVPLVRTIMSRGHRVRLFCNGAEEDAATLDRVANSLADDIAAGDVVCAPVPTRPRDLAHLVAQNAAVVAHRLHACIVAFSYRRPVVGLGWDRKVESFFRSVGMSAAFAPAGTAVDGIADRLQTALHAGIAPAQADRVAEEALDGVRLALAPVMPGTPADTVSAPQG
ncbi:MAG: polysaccharide pyruvyl transferase family protein [Pseudomonadota bacterium]